MKNFLKGFICGILVVGGIMPVIAGNNDIFFNQVRICIDGITKTNWDENMFDTDVPSSISYKNTTFVPLRWVSENLKKQVVWNGDSRTVAITESEIKSEMIAEKADLKGNVWKYYISYVEEYESYLKICDEKRGYERRYKLLSIPRYSVREDCILFIDHKADLYKINFLNDENSQDGEQLASLGASLGFTYAEFDDEYLYTIMADWGTGAHDYISIFDLNGKYLDSYHAGRGEDIVSLKIENVKDNKVKMNFNREYMSFSTPTEIIFNKETNKFEEQD